MNLSQTHFWIGLFDATGQLKDNFLMYVGDVKDDRHFGNICQLGVIAKEHLDSSGCCVYAELPNGLVASIGFCQPFTPGDRFRYVEEAEYRALVGEENYHAEMCQIAEQSDRLRAIEDWRPSEPPSFPVPAVDTFLDFTTAPEWLKRYVSDRFKNEATYLVPETIGFLARIGDDQIRERATEWAKALNEAQREMVAGAAMHDLDQAYDSGLSLPNIQRKYPDEFPGAVAAALCDRDICESLRWILQAAGHPLTLEVADLDQRLCSMSVLFETPLSGQSSEAVKLLRLVRERCPDAWWAQRAKLD